MDVAGTHRSHGMGDDSSRANNITITGRDTGMNQTQAISYRKYYWDADVKAWKLQRESQSMDDWDSLDTWAFRTILGERIQKEVEELHSANSVWSINNLWKETESGDRIRFEVTPRSAVLEKHNAIQEGTQA